MLRKRYYIVFVARDEEGHLRKIPLPLKYAYGFLVAAIIGASPLWAGRVLHPHAASKPKVTTRFARNAKTLRLNYQRMAEIAHNRSIQVAFPRALANEVTAL